MEVLLAFYKPMSESKTNLINQDHHLDPKITATTKPIWY